MELPRRRLSSCDGERSRQFGVPLKDDAGMETIRGACQCTPSMRMS